MENTTTTFATLSTKSLKKENWINKLEENVGDNVGNKVGDKKILNSRRKQILEEIINNPNVTQIQ